jgi:hypothetical protein
MTGGPQGHLVRIDPRTLRITRVRIPDTADDFYCAAAATGRIWVAANNGYGIYPFNPRTGHWGTVIRVQRMTSIAGTRSALWFSAADQPATLHAVKADGTPIEQVSLPTAPLGFTIVGTTLYAGFTRPNTSAP